MLVSQVLMLLKVPVSKVVRTVGDIRAGRYATLRNIYRHDGAQAVDDTHAFREELRSLVLPPQTWGIGHTLREIRERGAQVVFTAIRRHGITGREPDGTMELREGDVVVIYGTPEALEHAEAVLLAG
jgi:CPA2 family monovalent cation:H+ antiporter-2